MWVVLTICVYENLQWLCCEECIWLIECGGDSWEFFWDWKDQVDRYYNNLGRKEGILEYGIKIRYGISRNLGIDQILEERLVLDGEGFNFYGV